MKRGRGNSSRKPWFSRGGANHFQNQRDKPLFAINRTANNQFGAANSDSDEDDFRPQQAQRQDFEPAPTDMSFSTEREHGEYVGWKLYFPEKSKLLNSTVKFRFLLDSSF
jgi:hypothetical protein